MKSGKMFTSLTSRYSKEKMHKSENRRINTINLRASTFKGILTSELLNTEYTQAERERT